MLGELCKRVFDARQKREYDEHSLIMSAKLLEMNPEMYTVWNYRREYLEPIIQKGGEEALESVEKELKVTEKALMRNPKSYATFHHRRWIVDTGFCSLEKELALVEQLLDADERNFHGWGYRRAIAVKMGLPVTRELAYSKKKIEQNFSNYSSWHHRSTILPMVGHDENVCSCEDKQQECGCIPLDVLREEFRFVRQALYTDPLDQSGWFYHRWLLGCLEKAYRMDEAQEKRLREDVLGILKDEAKMCDHVFALEPEAKWPSIAALQIGEFIENRFPEQSEDIPVNDRQTRLASLMERDPMHRCFYQDVANGDAHPWSSLIR